MTISTSARELPMLLYSASSALDRGESGASTPKHPAEIVLAALLSGRAVTLPDRRTYRLGDDLTLCVGTEESRCEFSLPREMQVGEFLRLCDRLSAEALFRIGIDLFLAEMGAQRQPSAL